MLWGVWGRAGAAVEKRQDDKRIFVRENFGRANGGTVHLTPSLLFGDTDESTGMLCCAQNDRVPDLGGCVASFGGEPVLGVVMLLVAVEVMLLPEG